MSKVTKRADGVYTITWTEYKATHRDSKTIWTTIRYDIPGECRDNLGRRTLMVYDQGTCLAIEGRGLVIGGAPSVIRVVRDEDGEWQVERASELDGYEWRRQKWQRSANVDRKEAVEFASSLRRSGMGEFTYAEPE